MTNSLALIFSGGGAQYVGMGKLFYDQYPVFRAVMDEACDVLHTDIKKVCFEGDLETLSLMNNSQVAIFTVSVGMGEVFRSAYGLPVKAMAGHSLGEYSALASAGVLSLKDGLTLVQKRGELLHEVGLKEEGSMMAVNGLAFEQGQHIVQSLQETGLKVFVSNFNSPKQFVLSGNKESILETVESMESAGGEVRILPIPTCSHCPLMEDAKSEFSEALESTVFGKMQVSVYSNITGSLYKDSKEVKASLLQHLVQPVLWEKTVHSMIGNDIDMMIEIGPQTVLKSINYFIDEAIPTLAFDDASDRLLLDGYFRTDSISKLKESIDRAITAGICQPNRIPSDKAATGKVRESLEKLMKLKGSLQQASSDEAEVVDKCKKYFLEILKGKGLEVHGLSTAL